MARGITVTPSLLSASNVKLAYLIKIEFDTVEYLTDNAFDISSGGNTYTASSHILKVGTPRESNKLSTSRLNITLSAVNQSYIPTFLGGDWVNKKVTISRAVLNTNNQIDGDPIVYFSGLISGFTIDESGDKSTIQIELTSHWADFERVAARRTNHSSQQYWFSTDNGMKYAADSIKNMKWGSK